MGARDFEPCGKDCHCFGIKDGKTTDLTPDYIQHGVITGRLVMDERGVWTHDVYPAVSRMWR